MPGSLESGVGVTPGVGGELPAVVFPNFGSRKLARVRALPVVLGVGGQTPAAPGALANSMPLGEADVEDGATLR